MGEFIAVSGEQLKNRGLTAAAVLMLTMPVLTQSEPALKSPSKPDFSEVRQLIQKHIIKYSNPSIAVAVAQRGEILWEEGFGWADRENRIPATEHTMYYMASIDKSFTTVALMLLQERKQLDFDRPINDYLSAGKLSSMAWNPAEATVRRVANHTAGLTTFYLGSLGKHLSIEETIRRYGVIFWPPGERFDYSNLGYQILEEVVARVSGKSYSNFMCAEIFRPLGMTHASVGIGPGLEKFVAQRYSVSRGVQPHARDRIYCSAHDLARFGMFCVKAHLPDQKRILSDATIDAMHDSPVSTGSAGRRKYSLSWWIDDDLFGYRGVLAQGGTDAAQAWLRLIPSEEIVVVALANNGMLSEVVVHEILSNLLPGYREKRARADEKKTLQDTGPAPLPGALAGTWKGIIKTYREDIPLTFSIAQSGDIHAKLGSQPSTLLTDAKFDKERLRGRMSADLGVEDIAPASYHLEFNLFLRDGTLKGAVETAPYPNLPFWVEMKKATESSTK